jgi:hypothetical protein
MPGSTAEYIQAYSRTGRKYSSIVVDVMKPSKETNQSYLKNFLKFHEYKDILVEAVPINRWATKAINYTLPGIFTSLLLNKYNMNSEKTLFNMLNIKEAIMTGKINKEKVKEELYESYGCKSDGYDIEIGRQYKDVIDDFVDKIFNKIIERVWGSGEKIIDGFKTMGYPIMNNLRETDEQVLVRLD